MPQYELRPSEILLLVLGKLVGPFFSWNDNLWCKQTQICAGNQEKKKWKKAIFAFKSV